MLPRLLSAVLSPKILNAQSMNPFWFGQTRCLIKKVENLLELISQNFEFAKDMFKGGATKKDVEKMREESKNVGKKKQTRQKETQSVGADEDKLASVALALLEPEVKRIDANVSAGIASMKELASSSLHYKDSVLASVAGMIKEMKSEIQGSKLEFVPYIFKHIWCPKYFTLHFFILNLYYTRFSFLQ